MCSVCLPACDRGVSHASVKEQQAMLKGVKVALQDKGSLDETKVTKGGTRGGEAYF